MSPLPAPRPIREYERIDRRRFDEEIRPSNQPAVLRGLASAWPAVEAARASDERLVDYLKGLRTPQPVRVIVGEPEIEGRFFYTDDLSALNFKEGMSPLDPFLDRLIRDRSNPRPYSVAVQSIPVPELLPGFDTVNRIDLLDPSIVPRIWMGNAIRVAPHYDLMENIGCVVAGRRRFTLYPPEQVANLYVGPFEMTPAGTPVSLVDTVDPDLDRYPRFADAAASAQSATLDPGDAIYIPFHWWHGVESLEPVNIFVNYWWNPAPGDLGNPYDALLHGLYSLRNLPPDQRAAWRAMFDQYVFCINGDPTAHLPENVRGFVGAPDSQQLERMRATLKQVLQRL